MSGYIGLRLSVCLSLSNCAFNMVLVAKKWLWSPLQLQTSAFHHCKWLIPRRPAKCEDLPVTAWGPNGKACCCCAELPRVPLSFQLPFSRLETLVSRCGPVLLLLWVQSGPWLASDWFFAWAPLACLVPDLSVNVSETEITVGVKVMKRACWDTPEPRSSEKHTTRIQ